MGRVTREIHIMHGVLCQMDIRNHNNQVYEGWLEEVRKVAHVMEDMVDEYLFLAGWEQDIGCCFYLKKGFRKPRSLLSLNRLASKVQIEKYLAHCDDSEHSVIALLGMGGLGKTTLAANIYKKERYKFQCHAWVSISQSYSRENILRNINKELFKDNVSVLSKTVDMDITCLEETLKRLLEQQKYMIILDDVWTPETFDDLSRTLIHNGKGSRLIIITRRGDIASLASQGHKSYDLFCKKAFPRDTNHACPADLKPLSEEIAKRCKGLPLAIVLVGSLLRVREQTMGEWIRIYNELSWEINNNSRLDHIQNVLYLTFIYLPTHLKSCFLYCSLFPEDYPFKREQLVRLWTSQGFNEERGESTLEEVAEGYLKDLIDRNMLPLVERNTFGRMKRFRMHDILRDLAVDLCEKNSFGVTDEDKCEGTRRLVLHKQKQEKHHYYTGQYSMSSSTIPLLFTESRYMTVLELSCLPIEKIPDATGDLFNLRHLILCHSKVKMLPNSIERLSNLLTLDLFGCDIHELPGGIVKLKKLRHLFAEKIFDLAWREFQCRSGMRMPIGLGNLTNLQMLQALEAQDRSLIQLGELTQVRSLRLWNVKGIYCRCINDANDENEVALLNVLRPSLQKLKLRGRLTEGVLEESPLVQVVGGHNLCELPPPSLSRLLNLTHLRLTRAYNGEQMAFLLGWFTKLKILELIDLPNMNQLEIQHGTMVILERLYLVNLRSMTEVPSVIEFLMPLQRLSFQEITNDFFELPCHSAIRGERWLHTFRE
ncbi:hypothetical protein ZWY2020_047807 [Hordeum vulgare]|nr:hypothetical protein ZWY2020_047807 [Hordeum vulgare]